MAVITDSVGITKKANVMGVPCMTLCENTERLETISIGIDKLLGINLNAIKPSLEKLFTGQWKKGGIPKKWDENAGQRMVDPICGKIFALNKKVS